MDNTQKPNKKDILRQLDNILKDEDFQKSARSSAFLKFIILKSLSGEGDRIKGYTIGVEVFKKPHNFDPDADASVRVEATRLRKSLALYYHGPGESDHVVIKIPKGAYKPIFYYSAAQKIPLITTQNSKFRLLETKQLSYMLLAIILGLVFAGNLLFNLNWRYDNNYIHDAPIIVVLPFYAIGDEGVRTLSEDIKSHLITNLTRFDTIKALSNDKFIEGQDWKGHRDQIGRKLGANYVLKGTVKKTFNALSVHVRLMDIQENIYVWSYHREHKVQLGDVDGFLKEVAGSIASQLASPYGVIYNQALRDAGSFTDNVAKPYQCILSYYAYSNAKNPEQHKYVRSCLEEIVADNPMDSNAWAYLSWIYGDEYRNKFNPVLRQKTSQEMSLEAAKKAVRTDPKNPRAHQYMGNAAFLNDKSSLALNHIKISVLLNPYDSEILADSAWNYGKLGYWNKSLRLAKRAIEMNPGHPRWYHGILFVYYYKEGEYKNALHHALEFYDANEFYPSLAVAVSYAGAGMDDDALNMAQNIEQKFPDFLQNPKKSWRSLGFSDDIVEKLIIGAEAAGIRLSNISTVNEVSLKH